MPIQLDVHLNLNVRDATLAINERGNVLCQLLAAKRCSRAAITWLRPPCLAA